MRYAFAMGYPGRVLDLDQLAPETLRPISRAEFDRMVALGLFDEDERLELLHGLLVRMSRSVPGTMRPCGA